MGAPIKVFWIEPTGRVQRYLRCYGNFNSGHTNPPCRDYHNACVPLDVVPAEFSDLEQTILRSYNHADFADRPWPKVCSGCGIPFGELAESNRQISLDQIYRAADGREFPLREAPPGAMWHAAWMGDWAEFIGPDGIALTVRLPDGHDWHVDSEASNCTRPQRVPVEGKPDCTRFVRTHYCWCRHGDPRTGAIHVDKNGNTCNAGAGSIATSRWHGFLHNGHLVSC